MAVNQRVAAAMAPIAIRLDLSPNAISVLNLGVGLATSAVVLVTIESGPRWLAGLVGLLGWQLAYSLDCLDGQIARAREMTSPEGAVLDLLCDFGVQLSVVFVLLTVGLAYVDPVVRGPLGVALCGGWLLQPYYAGIAERLGRGSQRAKPSPLRTLRDYGLYVLILPLVMPIAPHAIVAIIGRIAAVNFGFAFLRIARFVAVNRGEPEP
jgi:phosphatidylglycerophosphate synthase